MVKKLFADEKDDILSLTKWIFHLSGIFGFWSFSVDTIAVNKKQSYAVKMRFFDWFRAISALLIYFLLMVYRWSTFGFYLKHDFSLIEVALNEMTMDSSVLMSILTIFMDIFNRQTLWKIIMTFNYMDEKVVWNICMHFIPVY